ncbi:MAG: DUF2231 domain-containing protein, partial [Chitinophagaceae bacterium]
MYSKVKLAGHPVHPMLIAFPVAFYAAALLCYIVYSSKGDAFWFKVALLANGAGVVMAAVAAIPGFIDWLNIPADSRAKKTGLFHMLCNVIALALYAINLLLLYSKWNDPHPDQGLAIVLTAAGFLFT